MRTDKGTKEIELLCSVTSVDNMYFFIQRNIKLNKGQINKYIILI